MLPASYHKSLTGHGGRCSPVIPLQRSLFPCIDIAFAFLKTPSIGT